MRFATHSYVAIAIVALAGCSGSSTPVAGTAVVPGGGSLGDAATQRAGAVAGTDADELADGPDGPGSRLYVANAGDDSIDVFRHVASGNVEPLRRIVGAKTGIVAPGQLGEDALGNLYLANGSSILVFAPGANGDVAPIRTIAGAATKVSGATSLTVDPADQSLYVFDVGYEGHAPFVLHFSPDATGDEAPIGVASPEAVGYGQVTNDSSDRDLIAFDGGACCTATSASVLTYSKELASQPYAPLFEISAIAAHGIVDDPVRRSYLVSTPDGIERFAEDTTGNGPLAPVAPSYSPPMEGAITSDTTSAQLAIGRARNVYAVHSSATGSGNATDAVYVYRHDADGAATPLRVLTGPATMLDRSTGIFVGR